MALRESKREATARGIKSAARRLFLAQGFAETTMEQVAESAGISRASLFNYFPGKAALLDALGGDFETRLLQAVEHFRSKYPRPQDTLVQLFAHAGKVLEQTAGITRLVVPRPPQVTLDRKPVIAPAPPHWPSIGPEASACPGGPGDSRPGAATRG